MIEKIEQYKKIRMYDNDDDKHSTIVFIELALQIEKILFYL